jgi:hypothetical protein
VPIIRREDYLAHIGTPRHSGRYPWGSGDDPHGSTRNRSLLGMVEDLKNQGLGEKEIAKRMDMSINGLRGLKSAAKNEQKQDDIHKARKLKAKGHSNVEIARLMSVGGRKIGDTQVGQLLKPDALHKLKVLDTVSDTLKRAVDEKEYIDVGLGTEHQMGITNTKLRTAVEKLRREGYKLHTNIQVEQLGTGQKTNMKVLTKRFDADGKEIMWGDVMKNRHKIEQVTDFSVDGGETMLGIQPPLSISSKRVGIRYAKDGGKDADGVIYVRQGPKDVSLGGNRYAQVRVMVDGTHYLKGMAIYKDDMPDGVDLLFNTNKEDTGNKLDAMKPLKRKYMPGDKEGKPSGDIDEDNPFGATIRQIGELVPGSTRVQKVTSVMNLVNKESDWDKWSRNLPSQFLSKQKPALAREQLDLTYTRKQTELEAILRLENPAVKKKMLKDFADGADSAAVHLKSAAMPRQKTQVILPLPDIKPTEIFAPGFNNGERVALVRFPHGGTFEIPELTVNNKHAGGRKLIGPNAQDAVGIHPKTAERLSGADFDGDTVLVIPNNLKKVQSSPALKGLENFDHQAQYKGYEGMKKMTEHEKGMEMGKISNLITDMTFQNATPDELARAVRHSMVVIDAEKHGLDFRRSAQDNNIPALKAKYQKGGGAYTLISRAKSEVRVNERKQGYKIDPETGKKRYTETGATRPDGKGGLVRRTQESTRLGEAEDAHTLSSGTMIEKVYADHSNRLKALADEARKALVATKGDRYDPAARKAYRAEVDSLDAKLARAIARAPRERQAQVVANAVIRQKIQENPDLKAKTKESKAELKRLKSQALNAQRQRMGIVEREKFDITDREWEAIQNKAITTNKLEDILNYADGDKVKELATPREKVALTATKANKARTMLASGYTWAEISESLGVSQSTIKAELKGTEEGD